MANSVLAVDLGRSRCRLALWVGDARSEASGPGAAGLATPGGAAHAEAAVLSLAAPLLRDAGVERLDHVSVGVAGAIAAPDAAREMAQHLCDRLPARHAAVTSDAITSHAGALGGRPGVVLAAGTGAVAVAVGVDGATYRADGWGPWLGDEGGGAWLGLQGLRAALRASDGRGPPTMLHALAIARFGPLAGLAAQIEADLNPPRTAATFAPDVARAAEARDPIAAALIHQAATALADAVRATAAKVNGGADSAIGVGADSAIGVGADSAIGGAADYAIVGGLAALGPILLRPLRAALRGGAPPLEPVLAQGTALDGARLLAVATGTVHEAAIHRAEAAAHPPPTPAPHPPAPHTPAPHTPAPRLPAPHPAIMDRLDDLATESLRPGLDDLDSRAPGDVVHLVLAAERTAHDALAAAAGALAAAAAAVAARMQAGGRLFYLGAGTPGRLAALDAAELPPTFGVPPDLVRAVVAGGPAALLAAVEGAEDDADAAGHALDALGLGRGDVVVGIAASGRTPFVVGGLRLARARGALTVAIVNNPGSPAAAAADLAVEILTGPEIIAGSTRMLAATAQKVALNALSTAVMVALGKTYGAHMVDVQATNAKLRRRALRTVQAITGAGEAAAAEALALAGGRVKPAVVALLAGVDVREAERRLAAAGGRVRDAVAGT